MDGAHVCNLHELVAVVLCELRTLKLDVNLNHIHAAALGVALVAVLGPHAVVLQEHARLLQRDVLACSIHPGEAARETRQVGAHGRCG